MLPVLQPPSHARDLPLMSFSEANGIFFGPVPILWTIHVGRHHWISLADAYRSLPENKELESDISKRVKNMNWSSKTLENGNAWGRPKSSLPETNSMFTPEIWCLEDHPFLLGHSHLFRAYIILLSGRVGPKKRNWFCLSILFQTVFCSTCLFALLIWISDLITFYCMQHVVDRRSGDMRYMCLMVKGRRFVHFSKTDEAEVCFQSNPHTLHWQW